MIKTKDLKIGTKITFIIRQSLIDGIIKEKNYMDKGDIDFLIETNDNKLCRILHRNLNLYYTNQKE